MNFVFREFLQCSVSTNALFTQLLNMEPIVLESQVEERNLRNEKFKEALLRAVRNLLNCCCCAAGEWIGSKHKAVTVSAVISSQQYNYLLPSER